MKLCIKYNQQTKQVLAWGSGFDSLLDGINLEVDDALIDKEFEDNCLHYEYDAGGRPCLVKSDACKVIAENELKVDDCKNRLIELDKLRTGQALERYLLDDDKSGLEAIREEAEECREFIRQHTEEEE
tara:strand:- start:537 stop:920 length:384 start_codon:yes stop_codon:yes gene_type:complete